MVKWVRVLKKQEKENRQGVGGVGKGKWVRVCWRCWSCWTKVSVVEGRVEIKNFGDEKFFKKRGEGLTQPVGGAAAHRQGRSHKRGRNPQAGRFGCIFFIFILFILFFCFCIGSF